MKERERLQLLSRQAVVTSRKSKKGKKGKSSNMQLVIRGSYREKLLQAGIDLPPGAYYFFVAFAALLVGYICYQLGTLLAFFAAGALSFYLLTWYLDERAEKRKRLIIPQLPGFIDGMTAALSMGLNVDGAIVQAAHSVPEGLLRSELGRVVTALDRGLSVNDAMNLLKQRVSGKEVTSLSVALDLFSSMGGSILEPFRRLAGKVREQQSVLARAHRDLVQVKQAFLILFFLSVTAPLILFIVEPGYLSAAFKDSLGRLVIQVACIFQIVALILFKKITNISI